MAPGIGSGPLSAVFSLALSPTILSSTGLAEDWRDLRRRFLRGRLFLRLPFGFFSRVSGSGLLLLRFSYSVTMRHIWSTEAFGIILRIAVGEPHFIADNSHKFFDDSVPLKLVEDIGNLGWRNIRGVLFSCVLSGLSVRCSGSAGRGAATLRLPPAFWFGRLRLHLWDV